MHYFGLWITAIQNERDLILKNAEKEKKKEVKELYTKKQRKILLFVIIIQLGILVILKYSTFLGANINSLLELLKIPIKLKFYYQHY